MAFVARAPLAAAVSAAGRLGVIAAAHGTPAALREEIRRVRELTDRPFGVDILFATVRTGARETEAFTDAVAPRLVAAAGGLADGRGLVAALAIRAREEGDVEHGSAAVWQSAGLVRDVRPAGQVLASIVEEAEAILRRLGARGDA
jgi:NAD(P)H-dependent flavin oxidoreductase YrpB (nitropropane dioxygenase family)